MTNNPKNNLSSNKGSITNHDFEMLFNELYPELCRYAIQFVRIEYIAEDIVQEQFIYLWEHRSRIKIHSSLKSYLYKAVRNKSVDFLRNKYANLKLEAENSAYEIPDNISADNIIEEEEILMMARKALDILPEKCHIVFSLSAFGNLSNRQIASHLKISVKTVQNQIVIANKKINAFLHNHRYTCALPLLISIPAVISL